MVAGRADLTNALRTSLDDHILKIVLILSCQYEQKIFQSL